MTTRVPPRSVSPTPSPAPSSVASSVSAVPGRDWRDTLRDATDLALLGILITLGSLPVLTAGAAWSAGSAAVADWLRTSSWPPARATLRRFAGSLLPGALATLGVGAIAGLLLLNLSAFARGVVPGGSVLVVVSVAVLVLALGLIALVLVLRGRGLAFWPSLVASWRSALVRPLPVAALGVIALVALFLALVLPICAPLVVGYTVFGAHVIAARLHLP